MAGVGPSGHTSLETEGRGRKEGRPGEKVRDAGLSRKPPVPSTWAYGLLEAGLLGAGRQGCVLGELDKKPRPRDLAAGASDTVTRLFELSEVWGAS